MGVTDTALAHAFAKALPVALVALYRQKQRLGQREFSTVAEAIDWIEAEQGITWLHLLDRTTGRLILTARPPLSRIEPVIRHRPQVHLRAAGHDERGSFRFELQADSPPFRVVGENYPSCAARDEAAEIIARLLHLELIYDVTGEP